jgi:hypothetical protein
MNPFLFWGCMAVAAVTACATARADDANTLPPDQPAEVNGIEVACSGVGDEARTDPRWPAFAVKIEFANRDAEYLSDIDVTVSSAADSEVLFHVRCETPWVLAKLPPGKYTVAGTYEGITKTAKLTAPASGQARIVVRFPEIAGEQ